MTGYIAPTLIDGEPTPAAMWQEALDALEVLDAPTNAHWSSGKIVASGGTLTIPNIPGTLKRLEVSFSARSDTAGVGIAMTMRVNGSIAANYRSNLRSLANTTQTAFADPGGTTFIQVANIPGTSVAAGVFSVGTLAFPVWSPTNNRLTVRYDSYYYDTAGGAANSILVDGGGQFSEAGPYTTLTLSGNLNVNSEATARGWF